MMKNNIDNLYFNNNLSKIAGLDEAGRGSLAGPIVVACVILPRYYNNTKINDSKVLSVNLRRKLYYEIIDNALDYSITIINVRDVEKYNPKKSSIIGMEKCIKKLKVKPDFILTDAEKISSEFNFKSIIHGDKVSQSIAAASIIAKYYRDILMENYNEIYPGYFFNENKGYGTKKHINAIKEKGITTIHRKTYKPIKDIILKLGNI